MAEQTIGTYYFQLAPSTKGISKSIDEAIGGAGSSIKSSFGSIMGVVAKGAAVAFGAAASGVGALAGAATNAYADFEQLSGGIETLFGDATEKTMANAEKAFKTTGLSMNEYMETAIQSSASMITSLGGDVDKASDMIDLSITDMADNVNKMGTTMEAVQNAYRGFSRGNFTMLDNLALGFAGTKEGMQELLDRAQELSGVEFDIGSYADIVEAIHIVQTDMGITGTTALEASQTISGSLNSLKSAWANVLTGIADENADFDSQIDALVESAGAFAENIIPRIEVAINGVGNLISKLAPKIAEKLPELISSVAPTLIRAVVSLFENLMSAIPKLIPVVLEIATSLISELGSQLPTFINILSEIVVELINGLSEALPIIIPVLIEAVLGAIQALVDNLPTILKSLLGLIETLVDSLLNKGLPILLDMLPDIIIGVINFIIGAIPQFISTVINIVLAIVKALPTIITKLIEAIPKIIEGLIVAIMENLPLFLKAGVDLFVGLIGALPEIIVELVKAIPLIITSIVKALVEAAPQMQESGKQLMQGLIDGLKSMVKAVGDTVKNIASKVADGFKDFFGIHSPSTLFASYGQYIDEGLAEGIEGGTKDVSKAMGTLNNSVIADASIVYDTQYRTSRVATPNDNAIYTLLAEFLPYLAQKERVEVNVNGNMPGIFDAMVQLNNEYKKRNGGESAYA